MFADQNNLERVTDCCADRNTGNNVSPLSWPFDSSSANEMDLFL